jgi:hypothetical protein
VARTQFTCTLTTTDETACHSYARVTIVAAQGASAPACSRHAVARVNGMTGAHLDWSDSKGLNEWERNATRTGPRTKPTQLAWAGPSRLISLGPSDVHQATISSRRPDRTR